MNRVRRLLEQRNVRIFGPVALVVAVCLVAVASGSLGRLSPGPAASAAPAASVTATPSSQAVAQAGVGETSPAQRETPTPATATPKPASTPTIPAATPTQVPDAGQGALKIGLQAGHWLESQLPDELAALRTSTGASGPGWTEQAVNLDIARRTAALLEADGYQVDVLPSTIPVGYTADVFLALHSDANNSSTPNGFKIARPSRTSVASVDDELVATFNQNFGKITGQRTDSAITAAMRYYYAFSSTQYQHAASATTPAAILEMGYMTNPGDRNLLTQTPDVVAKAVATCLEDFLKAR